MFSRFFSKPKMTHPLFGEITLRQGQWQGTNAPLFGTGAVKIRMPGDADGPSQTAASAVEELNGSFGTIKNALAQQLYDEHYINGKQAADADGYDYPIIASPAEIWNFASVFSVVVDPYPNVGATQVQIVISADWDEEHLLGFTFQDGQVIEFNKSVPPF